mmetsp:Transcript_54696/g.105625  ORF Transcript_54696/g.105625 Transcript_54696/m.105625 type:complete len:205 (+) Transcript_54696:128-742(+)
MSPARKSGNARATSTPLLKMQACESAVKQTQSYLMCGPPHREHGPSACFLEAGVGSFFARDMVMTHPGWKPLRPRINAVSSSIWPSRENLRSCSVSPSAIKHCRRAPTFARAGTNGFSLSSPDRRQTETSKSASSASHRCLEPPACPIASSSPVQTLWAISSTNSFDRDASTKRTKPNSSSLSNTGPVTSKNVSSRCWKKSFVS